MFTLVQGILRLNPWNSLSHISPKEMFFTVCLAIPIPLFHCWTKDQLKSLMQCQGNRPISSNPSRFFPTYLARWGVDWLRGQEKCNFPIWGPAAYIHTHLNESPHLHLTQQESHCNNQGHQPRLLFMVQLQNGNSKLIFQTSGWILWAYSPFTTHMPPVSRRYSSKFWRFCPDTKRIHDIM